MEKSFDYFFFSNFGRKGNLPNTLTMRPIQEYYFRENLVQVNQHF